MQQQRAIWRAIVGCAALAGPAPLAGQVVITTDAGAFNNYTWRGVTMTNKLVVQPDAYLTIPGGGGSAVIGAWGNLDAGQYDDPVNDFSEGGGTGPWDATEIDVWAEYGHPLGTTLTGTMGGLLTSSPMRAGSPTTPTRPSRSMGSSRRPAFHSPRRWRRTMTWPRWTGSTSRPP